MLSEFMDGIKSLFCSLVEEEEAAFMETVDRKQSWFFCVCVCAKPSLAPCRPPTSAVSSLGTSSSAGICFPQTHMQYESNDPTDRVKKLKQKRKEQKKQRRRRAAAATAASKDKQVSRDQLHVSVLNNSSIYRCRKLTE